MRKLLLLTTLASAMLFSGFARASADVDVTKQTAPVPSPVKHHHKNHKKKSAPVINGVAPPPPLTPAQAQSPVMKRVEKEEKISANSFAINFYKPTYLLPYYYTATPYQRVYKNNTPDDLSVRHSEIKYQLSFKVPLWKDIFNYPSTLYLAYTQQSYWQAYNNMAFFRETDYQPEMFFANETNLHLSKNWLLNFINLGLTHQSNGFGGLLERSWNRAYVEGIFSTSNWMVSLKPWIIFHDSTFKKHNPNMGYYMGHGQLLVAYKYYHQVISLSTHNFVESGGRRAGMELNWSFPLTQYLNGFFDFYTGYGQSLIEYNHRTNGVGVGFALSNWI